MHDYCTTATTADALMRLAVLHYIKGAAPPNAAPRRALKNTAPRKIFPQFSFRGAARRGAASSVATAMINSKVYLFLTHRAALGGAASTDFFGATRRGV